MARGIDIPELDVVVNFDVPHVPEEYIHRVGRTGRASATGLAITFVSSVPIVTSVARRVVEINEQSYMEEIEKLMDKKLSPTKVPGPWADENKAQTPSPSVLATVPASRIEETLELLKEKQTRIADNAARRRKIKQATNVEKRAYQLTKKKEVSLSDFAEGRYDQVLQKIESKRVIKQGIAVPADFAERISFLEGKKLAERKEKREKMLTQQKALLKTLKQKRKE
eukprot:TRINITY_DN6848_c0_g1_i2.p1 TRINITY_DN6848_c0_g1~~TRINITY_DN6848_c0_g1_i2.p1  ORF type:complete len:225 (-),score=55.47 TRINITY_DN6848_c0_g1_i2:66-740(-)